MGTIISEAKRFLENTSMKGVPRIVKGESVPLRCLWFFSVLVGLGLCAWSLTTLFGSYFQYNTTIHKTVESTSEDLESIQKLVDTFPEITVCNTNPFSSHANYSLAPITPEEYLDKARDALQDLETTNNSFHDLVHSTFILDQASPVGYFQFIGQQIAAQLSHQEEEFVVDCHVEVFIGSWPAELPCGDLVKIKQTTSPQYYNCFTVIYAKLEQDEVLPFGISLTLHLDDAGRKEDMVREAPGVVLYLAERNTAPDEGRTIRLSPGTLTEVSVTSRRMVKLPAPHGDCRDDSWELYDLDGRPLLSTMRSCYRACARQITTQQCNCSDIYLPLSYHPDKYEDWPYCFSLQNGTQTLIQNVECSWRNTSIVSICTEHCPALCGRIEHDVFTTTSVWPAIQWRAFHDRHINGRSYAEQYPLSLLNQTNGEVLRDNFLNVKVRFRDIHVTVLEETPIMTPVQLLSQAGGLFNLLCGISVFVIVEVVEMIGRILHKCMAHKNDVVFVKSNAVE